MELDKSKMEWLDKWKMESSDLTQLLQITKLTELKIRLNMPTQQLESKARELSRELQERICSS